MAVLVLASLVVLGIAMYQTVQGLFNAMIFAMLSIISALMAFALFEPLAAMLYTRQPAYAYGVGLGAVFVLSLLVLRLLFDLTIRGNVVFGDWTNRIGGALFGLVGGIVVVGMLLVSMQQFPFDRSVLTYAAFNPKLERNLRIYPFCPDDFVVGLAEVTSSGSMSAGREFGDAHDHFIKEAYCARNTAGLNGRVEAGGKKRRTGDDGYLASAPVEVYLPGRDDDALPWEFDTPLREQGQLVVVRVVVDGQARNGEEFTNAVNWWHLPATHFRLVARDGESIRSFYPVGYLTHYTDEQMTETPIAPDQRWQVHFPVADFAGEAPPRSDLFVARKYSSEQKDLVVDWVYRVPSEYQVDSLIFRRLALQRTAKPQVGMPPITDAEGKHLPLTRSSRWERQQPE